MSFFEAVYEHPSTTQILFQNQWCVRGDRPYYGATSEKVRAGQVLKAHDKERSRRILLVGTRLGTVVVFDIYENGAGNFFGAQFPTWFPPAFAKTLLSDGATALNLQSQLLLVGDPVSNKKNIGQLLTDFFNADEEYKRLSSVPDMLRD